MFTEVTSTLPPAGGHINNNNNNNNNNSNNNNNRWTHCVLNTDNVLTHTQNNINACIHGVACSNYFVNTTLAHFQHYRHDCYEGPSCEYRKKVVKDTRIWRYLDKVVERTNDARKIIDFD